MSKKETPSVGYRSAVTGQYVKPSYASKHPKTTVSITKKK
jgi:hypothetical protein